MKYTTKKPYQSRLARQENKRFAKQTVTVIVVLIILLLAIITIGVPAMVKIAVFLGNTKDSGGFADQQDTIPPATPQIITPPEATYSATLTLNGYAEPGSIITLYQDDYNVKETTVDAEGTFSFSDLALSEGANRFHAIAKDPTGNQSHQSTTHIVILDKTPPSLTITSPADGTRFFGPLEQIVEITGTTDPQTQVKLNDQFLLVDSTGTFSGRYSLSEGENTLNFTATDLSGNHTNTELKLTYSK